MKSLIDKILNTLDFAVKDWIFIGILALICVFGFQTNSLVNDINHNMYTKDYNHGYQVMKSLENGDVSTDPSSSQYIGSKPALISDLKDACINPDIVKELAKSFNAYDYCKLV